MGSRIDIGKQQRWLELVRLWQGSQLSVRQFCRRQRIREADFYAWRRTLRQRGLLAETAKESAAFVQVALAAAAADAETPVEVVLGRRVLRVRAGFAADVLLQLVRLLEDAPC